MAKIFELYGTGGDQKNKPDTFIVGVECEIEGFERTPEVKGWERHSDGSLRNNGYEYVSSPDTLEGTLEKFKLLHKTVSYLPDLAFSERTSTHVHVNVSPMDANRVRAMVLLYAMFEPFFFESVKPERSHNIHCVKLTDTILPMHYNRELDSMVTKWSKYTALNLLPVTKYGTLEFRHLHGTGDVQELSDWLHILKGLWVTANEMAFTEKIFLDVKGVFMKVFRFSPKVQENINSVESICYNQLLDTKLAFLRK
jgi:Putative amidoligase enzyme